VLYEAAHAVIPPLAKAVWRPRVTGLGNVPREGAAIVASNHLSFIDSVVLSMVAPRKVAFLAKEEYFTGTGLRGASMRAWFEFTGAIPVNRDDTRAAIDSLQVALDVLRKGDAFGIYPEGTRSRDGLLYRGRTGVAQLALESGAPIVPVGLIGTDKLQPVGSRLPKLVRIDVAFGTPIRVTDEHRAMPAGKARRLITDEVMDSIQRLSGQELAGKYNERPEAAPSP
jgi:1-acyl-sn-glycerol-3-phosphate acyltransferase